jgi:hypothetical protein
MANMGIIVGAIIAITVSVIVLASVLAPTIAEYTGSGGALAEYSAILGAVMLMAIVGILMVAVRLITSKA